MAEVALGAGDCPATLLTTPAGHTTLPALAVRASPAPLDTDSLLAPVTAPAVRGAGAGEGEGETLQGGVASGGGRAGAQRLVVADLALSAATAGRAGAGVLALGGDTGLATSTLGVTGAPSHTEPDR